MKYKSDICKNIFRGYDIRGIHPSEIDEDTAYTIGLGFGSHIKSIGKTNCVVGHDNRLSSPILYEALIKGITETGIDVISLGLCTTPMYYYACIKLKVFSGVMVTASHNPKDDNGFKFAFDEAGNCKGQEIQDFLEFILKGEFSNGEGHVSNYDITNDYIELFKNNINFGKRRIKVVVDPGNGTTAVIVKKIYDLFPMDIVYINDDSDGTFPNHHPDPSEEKNIKELKEALKNGYDIGFGFDGDADRIAVLTPKRTIKGDDLAYLYAKNMKNPRVLGEVKCSQNMYDEIDKIGKSFMGKTGHSNIKKAMKELNIDMAAEVSGHIFFKERFFGFDDGVYAMIRVLELIANGFDLDGELDKLPRLYSTDEMKIKADDESKFKIIETLKIELNRADNGLPKIVDIIDIDGVRIKFENGWGLVRASNTTPVIVTRFEANSEQNMLEIQNGVIALVDKIMANINA